MTKTSMKFMFLEPLRVLENCVKIVERMNNDGRDMKLAAKCGLKRSRDIVENMQLMHYRYEIDVECLRRLIDLTRRLITCVNERERRTTQDAIT